GLDLVAAPQDLPRLRVRDRRVAGAGQPFGALAVLAHLQDAVGIVPGRLDRRHGVAVLEVGGLVGRRGVEQLLRFAGLIEQHATRAQAGLAVAGRPVDARVVDVVVGPPFGRAARGVVRIDELLAAVVLLLALADPALVTAGPEAFLHHAARVVVADAGAI